MNNSQSYRIRRFEAKDQAAAKDLINLGLGEHFGFVDESLNPDLNDIATTFVSGCFLIGEVDGMLIATGGYKLVSPNCVQIERVSVAQLFRRGGYASQLVNALVAEAKQVGYQRIILETTTTWTNVIAFWQHNGFRITHTVDSTPWPETWFERWL